MKKEEISIDQLKDKEAIQEFIMSYMEAYFSNHYEPEIDKLKRDLERLKEDSLKKEVDIHMKLSNILFDDKEYEKERNKRYKQRMVSWPQV